MNRQGKHGIEWTDWTWSPVTGCLHGCWYCYAQKLFTRFHKSFEPLLYPERLGEPFRLKGPTDRNNQHRKPWIAKAYPHQWLVFTCSVADLFDPWTPTEWMDEILYAIWEHDRIMNNQPNIIFQLLTKNPERIPQYDFPPNVWVGTTVTTEHGDIQNIAELKKVKAKVRFVSFEPLLGGYDEYLRETDLSGIQWVIIGKLTGSRKVKFNPLWLYDVLLQADLYHVPVFIKDSVPLPEGSVRRQGFPT